MQQVVDGRTVPVAVKSGRGTVGIFAKHARIIRGLIPGAGRRQRGDPGPRRRTSPTARHRGPAAHRRQRVRPCHWADQPHDGQQQHRSRNREGDRDHPSAEPATLPGRPDSWLVSSIEEYDLETGKATKGPIFSERVVHAPADPVIVSAADALAVTLAERGVVDMDHIAELLGRDRDTTIAELGETICLEPGLTTEGFEVWQTGKYGRPATSTCPGMSAGNRRLLKPQRSMLATPADACGPQLAIRGLAGCGRW